MKWKLGYIGEYVGFRVGRRCCVPREVSCGIWGFPKIRGTILGVPIRRTIVYWGLYWGPPISGNYHMENGRGNLDCRV